MWEGRHNYQLNSATVLRDLYRLFSMVAGDEALMTAAKNRNDPLRSLRDQFIEDELVHLLVGTAVTSRVQLEHMSGPRNDAAELSFKPIDTECGKLQPDCEEYKFKPLTFHEACHKIIHALNIVAQTPGKPEETSVKMEVSLRGQLGKKTWIAHLDLLEYIRASVRNFNNL